MARVEPGIEHLLRRAGFGASQEDVQSFQNKSVFEVLDHLIDYERQPDDVDTLIGGNAYVGIVARGPFAPSTSIEDARQRWLFRMVHTKRPLQERMALFWHNHFATAYSKLAGEVGAAQATKMLALKSGELAGPPGQLEMFRARAMGSFRDLLVDVARDPAMLVWLDGRFNTRVRPQENFAREIMELFTFGIGNFTEADVYAAARVFTGWNLRRVNPQAGDNSYYEFVYNANLHETAAKQFTFPIYRDGSTTIPSRAASAGMQDGIDLITALATHPATARRLARKLWAYFVSEEIEPDESVLNDAVGLYLQRGTEIGPLVHRLLRAREFLNPRTWYTRYSWPAEYAVRAVKEVGWVGFSVDTVRTQLAAMGQTLFEPPDVNGWDLGRGWFTTGGMLARMNFAATLAANQRFNLARDASGASSSPDTVLDYFLERLSPFPYNASARRELVAYLESGGAWTGSESQLRTKAAGLARLIVGSAEYQVI